MVNCALMGVDWRSLTWWEYSAMLFAWNERHSDEKPVADLERLGKSMAAHGLH